MGAATSRLSELIREAEAGVEAIAARKGHPVVARRFTRRRRPGEPSVRARAREHGGRGGCGPWRNVRGAVTRLWRPGHGLVASAS